MSQGKDDPKLLLALLILWLGLTALVKPSGDFPLNDDWSYAHAVESLLTTGSLQLTDWTSMTLVAQVLWGAFFSLLLGFSFETLRIATIVAGFLALCAVYLILRRLDALPGVAFLGAITLAVNPIFFNLSLTFMTDVPFLAAQGFSIYYFLRALKSESGYNWIVATIFSIMATLIRQVGLFIPVAAAITASFRKGESSRFRAASWTPALLTVACLSIYQVWLDQSGQRPQLYPSLLSIITVSLSEALGNTVQLLTMFYANLFVVWLYLGLFLLPFTIYYFDFKAVRRNVSKWEFGASAVGFGLLLLLGFKLHHFSLMPIAGNILFNMGAGPVLLQNWESYWPQAPLWARLLLTIAATAGTLALGLLYVMVAKRLFRTVRKKERMEPEPLIFALVATGLFIGLIMNSPFIDRYLLPLIPLQLVIIFMAGVERPLGCKIAPVCVLFLFGLFSVASSHDYFSWNRSRWQAITLLMEEKDIPVTEINGGFEFYGLFFEETKIFETIDTPWWVARQPEYMISLGLMQHYRTEFSLPFNRWLPPGTGRIVVLRRIRDPLD